MNRTLKSLILAAGVAAATLTVTVAPAQADGPGDIQIGPIVDPEPTPEPLPVPPKPKPQPQVPNGDVDEIANPPKCTHGCGGDEAPDDVINSGPLEADEPNEPNQPQEDPANDAPLDQGCFTDCDLPEEPEAQPTDEPTVAPAVLDADEPTAVDELAPATSEDGGIDPLWFLLGGAGAGALILAAVARRRRQQAEEHAPLA